MQFRIYIVESAFVKKNVFNNKPFDLIWMDTTLTLK